MSLRRSRQSRKRKKAIARKKAIRSRPPTVASTDLEREHDDDGGDQRDDAQSAHERVQLREEAFQAFHQCGYHPVMNARTASAAASAAVPANQARRFGPAAGA